VYFCDLLKRECSPVKMACHPLNYLLHFRIRDNWRSARPCFACSSVGSPIKYRASREAKSLHGISLRVSLFNKRPKSYALWCFMLSTSCFAFDVSHSKAEEGGKAIRSCRVGRRMGIGMEEARRSSVTRDLPPYRGVAVDLLLPPSVQELTLA
jgi:hypothetical protein